MLCTVGSLSAKLIFSVYLPPTDFLCPAVGSFVSTTSSYHFYTLKTRKRQGTETRETKTESIKLIALVFLF
jgi:hypothetical protein